MRSLLPFAARGETRPGELPPLRTRHRARDTQTVELLIPQPKRTNGCLAMSRQLLLLRHAKSAWDTGAPTDFERPLASRGERDAPVMGSWMKKQGMVPTVVVSSPAMRAKQTAEAACERMGVKKKKIVWDERLYAASASQLLAVLEDYKKKPASLMLVGHNPGLEDLLIYLLGNKLEAPPDGKMLPTAAAASIELADNWEQLAEGAGRLLSLTRVKDLS